MEYKNWAPKHAAPKFLKKDSATHLAQVRNRLAGLEPFLLVRAGARTEPQDGAELAGPLRRELHSQGSRWLLVW